MSLWFMSSVFIVGSACKHGRVKSFANPESDQNSTSYQCNGSDGKSNLPCFNCHVLHATWFNCLEKSDDGMSSRWHGSSATALNANMHTVLWEIFRDIFAIWRVFSSVFLHQLETVYYVQSCTHSFFIEDFSTIVILFLNSLPKYPPNFEFRILNFEFFWFDLGFFWQNEQQSFD